MIEKDAQTWLNAAIRVIKQCEASALDRFIEIGAELNGLKKSNAYMYIRTKNDKLGYDSFYDLVKEYLGYSKSTTNRYIAVYKKFSDPSSDLIKKQFADYSFAQLCEMLSLVDSQIAKCNPSMTCEEIRELKKKDKGKVDEEEFVADPNTSLQIEMSEELYNKVLEMAKRQKKQMANFVVEILELYISTLPQN